jgi:hypothetical protein
LGADGFGAPGAVCVEDAEVGGLGFAEAEEHGLGFFGVARHGGRWCVGWWWRLACGIVVVVVVLLGAFGVDGT